MAADKTDKTTQSRTSRKAAEKAPARSRSSKSPSAGSTKGSRRAQPKAAAGSRATRTMSTPPATRAASRRTAAATGRTASSRRGRQSGGAQTWMHSLETMITSREGREIIAEALRAIATVLDTYNRDRQGSEVGSRPGKDAGGVHRFGEALGQDMHSSDPVTNPAAEMVSGAFGVAQAATEAATGVMLGGTGLSSETEQTAGGRRAGKRRSSRTSSGTDNV